MPSRALVRLPIVGVMRQRRDKNAQIRGQRTEVRSQRRENDETRMVRTGLPLNDEARTKNSSSCSCSCSYSIQRFAKLQISSRGRLPGVSANPPIQVAKAQPQRQSVQASRT